MPGKKGLFSSRSIFIQPTISAEQLKKTKLSEEFDYEKFRKLYGESAIILFAIDEAKHLTIAAVEDALIPKNGQTVIALVDRKEENVQEE